MKTKGLILAGAVSALLAAGCATQGDGCAYGTNAECCGKAPACCPEPCNACKGCCSCKSACSTDTCDTCVTNSCKTSSCKAKVRHHRHRQCEGG